MPVYSYRCRAVEGHVTEHMFSMSGYPPAVQCGECGADATLVILHAPYFDVDRVSEEFNVGAGQVFHSRAERREWCRQTGHYEIGPEDSWRHARQLRDLREAKADLGDAWDGDIPGRREGLMAAARSKAYAAYEGAAEAAARDLQGLADAEAPPQGVRRAMRKINAESAGVSIQGGSVVCPAFDGATVATRITQAGMP